MGIVKGVRMKGKYEQITGVLFNLEGHKASMLRWVNQMLRELYGDDFVEPMHPTMIKCPFCANQLSWAEEYIPPMIGYVPFGYTPPAYSKYVEFRDVHCPRCGFYKTGVLKEKGGLG